MPEPTPAQQAALDELDAAGKALSTYINGLDGPDLLAELRCMLGRLITNLDQDYGTGHPATVTAVAIGEGISRFDLDGHRTQQRDGTITEDAPYQRPLPMAVKASEDCRCDTPDGGIRKRIADLHRITHRLMGDRV